MKASADVRGLAEGLDPLGDSNARRAFVHTARSVIDPRGQRPADLTAARIETLLRRGRRSNA